MSDRAAEHPAPVLIAACGNAMAGDDAFGPAAVRRLRRAAPPSVDVVELDLRPAALLDEMPGRDGVILIDAVTDPNRAMGQFVDLDWFDPRRPELASDDPLSSHGLGLGTQIELAGRLNILPRRVWLLGVTIDAATVGQPLSPAARRLAPVAAARASALAMHWTAPEISHA